jgi:O-antigen ligase
MAAAAVVFLVPLALAPGLFFYYDITPKVVLLLVGASVLAVLASLEIDSLHRFRASRFGRWYTGFALALAALSATAASLSPLAALAWYGSNWRRYGAITEIATLGAAYFIASALSVSYSKLRTVLGSLCAAGTLAAVYGILQYFGWDPFLSASVYESGVGPFRIVRPPSTLGHSDYFAAFLLWPVFAGVGLWSRGGRARWLGALATISGAAAVTLSGSRGALLGLLVGAFVAAYFRRPRPRTAAALIAGLVAAGLAFYVSPAGARLRARAYWIGDDPTGGARPLLWRDSLRMAAAHAWIGSGPDVFVAEFPQFQSRELARAYPAFYHESPHNILLDALTSEGILGVLVLAGLIATGLAAGLHQARQDPVAAALLAALTGVLAAQQFVVFTSPTAFAFYLGIGLLAGLENLAPARPSQRASRTFAVMCGVVVALPLLWVAYHWVAADIMLARAQRLIAAGDATGAVQSYDSAYAMRRWGVTGDLAISRQAADASSRAAGFPAKFLFANLAAAAASAATSVPEQRQNAWYNLAILEAGAGDSAAVEASLRSAIAASPNWFKPHWTLAKLLFLAGRAEEARKEAALGLDLNGGKDAEVAATLGEILRSPEGRP